MPILVTLEVLKFVKSNEVNDEHPWNIPIISVTLEVLKLDTSNEVNNLQKANITNSHCRL